MIAARALDDFTLALAWLTRLPVRWRPGASGRRLGQAAWSFPLVGIVTGAAGAGAFVLLEGLGAPPLLAAALVAAALTVLTGALHEDGLADVCDGLGVRGGRDAALAAMRDSRVGSYGVLALIAAFAVRVAALAALGPAGALALPPAMALGRAAMVWPMARAPLARADGAAAGAGRADGFAVFWAAAIALAVTALLAAPAGYGVGGAALAPLLAFAVTVRVVRIAERRFGGATGDVLGAICLLSETSALVLFALSAGTGHPG
jgi:adenosylcobinamide-GDP ribazoletransferase